jgi:hypothetical protein
MSRPTPSTGDPAQSLAEPAPQQEQSARTAAARHFIFIFVASDLFKKCLEVSSFRHKNPNEEFPYEPADENK